MFLADGSLDIGQLHKDFGMDLGTLVALKADKKNRNVFEIVKFEGQTITLDDHCDKMVTVTAYELVNLYKVWKHESDIFVRSGELLQIEDHAPVRAKYASTAAEQVLLQAYRLNQPNVAVNVKLTKDRNSHVFAADKYPIGGLKLVPYSSNLHSVAVEGK